MPEQPLPIVVPPALLVAHDAAPTDGNTIAATPGRTYVFLANPALGFLDGGDPPGPLDDAKDGGAPAEIFDDGLDSGGGLDGGGATPDAIMRLTPQILVRPGNLKYPALSVPTLSVAVPTGSFRIAGPIPGAYVDAAGLAHLTWSIAGSVTCQPFTVPQ